MQNCNSKFKIFGFLFFLIFNFAFLTFNFDKAEASALSLGVSPPILQIEAVPPASIKTPITIQNLTETTVLLDILFKPFTASKEEDGQVEYLSEDLPIFQKMQILDNEHSVKTVTLGPSQSKTLTLHIGIPKDEPAKDYYFSVLFIANPEPVVGSNLEKTQTNQTQTAGGIATNVLLSVGPKGQAQGLIEEFSAPLFLEKGPVPFTVRVKNTGEHAIAPSGEILIVNMFGQIVGKVELAPVNILAGTIRAIPDLPAEEDSTPSATPQLLMTNDQSPRAFWPESFLLGPYSATLTLSLSDQGPKFSRTIRFFALPIQAFLGIILALLIVFFIRARLSRHPLLLLTFSLITLSLLFPKNAYADRLIGASDTISTSRPSSTATLAKDQPADTSHVVIADNGSLFLAQDSALLGSETVTVASMSASNTPESNQRIVYLTKALKTTQQKGAPIIVPVKARHTIKFTTVNAIPQNGKIVITFEGEGSKEATASAGSGQAPSATTFTFNGLTPSQIQAKNASCAFTILAPVITCQLSSGVSSQTTVTILIGAPLPTLINPTKTKADEADIWSVKIKTQDDKSQDLDSASVKISTIEPVRVVAEVEPTLTFTIAGIASGTKIKDHNSACAENNNITNSGIASEADFFDLGALSSKKITISAHDLIASTNLKNGYSITATAGGKLRNLITGYSIASSEIPSKIQAKVENFGIHPCGLDANREDFGSGSLGKSAKLAWPLLAKPLLLASRSSPADLVKTTVEYAVSIKNDTPVGIYKTVISYLVLPTF